MIENFRRQYAKNLVTLRGMLEKARDVAPKKYRGYTVQKLEASVSMFERIVAMNDDELRDWLSPERLAERVAAMKAAR